MQVIFDLNEIIWCRFGQHPLKERRNESKSDNQHGEEQAQKEGVSEEEGEEVQ